MTVPNGRANIGKSAEAKLIALVLSDIEAGEEYRL
jgi:hypothetical protein